MSCVEIIDSVFNATTGEFHMLERDLSEYAYRVVILDYVSETAEHSPQYTDAARRFGEWRDIPGAATQTIDYSMVTLDERPSGFWLFVQQEFDDDACVRMCMYRLDARGTILSWYAIPLESEDLHSVRFVKCLYDRSDESAFAIAIQDSPRILILRVQPIAEQVPIQLLELCSESESCEGVDCFLSSDGIYAALCSCDSLYLFNPAENIRTEPSSILQSEDSITLGGVYSPRGELLLECADSRGLSLFNLSSRETLHICPREDRTLESCFAILKHVLLDNHLLYIVCEHSSTLNVITLLRIECHETLRLVKSEVLIHTRGYINIEKPHIVMHTKTSNLAMFYAHNNHFMSY